MADTVFSIQYLKDFLNAQIHDEEKWAFNMVRERNVGYRAWFPLNVWLTCQKLLRAVGLFGGSILLMRNYGDLMAI